MKELYIVWAVIVCFILISADSKGVHLWGGSGESNRGNTYYGRGWGWGSGGGGGGYHK